ncbi:hypothetical protein ACQP2E_07135 [Actinoplanes sp. CA-015351]|uniref:hypothetical protein n=1 Tax=Actinoplanes sp. CA-015351 TaxID=3239897 RepID=UPI003D99B6A1
MIPFTNPEIQLELIRQQGQELAREAAKYRRARALRPEKPRHWPRFKRPSGQSVA